jgi:hypothetical protein
MAANHLLQATGLSVCFARHVPDSGFGGQDLISQKAGVVSRRFTSRLLGCRTGEYRDTIRNIQ